MFDSFSERRGSRCADARLTPSKYLGRASQQLMRYVRRLYRRRDRND
jgi:hypothetical protein